MFFGDKKRFDITPAEAMRELQEQTRDVYQQRRNGTLSQQEAEQQLESLAVKYETPFDRLISD